jgi:single-strand DNA-binding protein
MSRSLNLVVLSGHLGGAVDVRATNANEKVASFSLATDEGYRDRDTGQWVNRAAWHRVVTYQAPLVEMLEKQGTKGRFAEVAGTLRYRKYRKAGEDSDRHATEILVDWSGAIRFPVPERQPSETEDMLNQIQSEIDRARESGPVGAGDGDGPN